MAKTIDDYKKEYEAARAKGDAAGMQAANDGANAIRRSQGQAEERADADIAKFKTTTPLQKTSPGMGSLTKKPSGSLGASQGGGLPTPQEVLAQGNGPRNVPMSGGQKQTSVTQSPEYQALAAQLGQLQQQSQQQNDYSDYVRQLQEAARAKSLAELEAAYQKNVNAIDAAKGQIAPQYTAARNQVAGQAAVSRKNWQETAAAMGLNSGAAGQSDIAMNLAKQNALAELDRGESADLAALELQRTQAATDYNSAIAQAQASGDYELAAALYQEKVRADEAQRADRVTQFQQMLQQMQFEYGVSQDALAQQNWELNRKDALEQQAWNNRFQEDEVQRSQQESEFNKLLSFASSYAEMTGDYGMFSQFGFTQDQINALNSAWASQNAPATQQAYRKTSGGSGSGTSGGSTSVMPAAAQGTNWRPVEEWTSLYGEGTEEDYIKANYKALGYTSQSAALAAWNNHRRDSEYTDLIGALSEMRLKGVSNDRINSFLVEMVNAGVISQQQKVQLQGAYVGAGR